MKIPQKPPSFNNIEEVLSPEMLLYMVQNKFSNLDRYYHWDKLRHITPPDGLTHKAWWFITKIHRAANKREIAVQDKGGFPFHYALPDFVLNHLHQIDQKLGGTMTTETRSINEQSKERYIQRSLIEEALTSSLIEGAVATRKEAQRLIHKQEQPKNQSERMIWNNYKAMQFIKTVSHQPLSIALIEEIHAIITHETLEIELETAYRKEGDGIAIYDDLGVLLFQPPLADEIPKRLQELCDFINQSGESILFLHPVIKSILLHFLFAYIHPFVDGNGRTARALFYWCMLKENFWLAEFISISAEIRKAPAQYGKAFLYTETDENDITYFIIHQLEVLEKAIKTLYDYFDTQSEKQKSLDQSILNVRQQALMIHALKNPNALYTFGEHQRVHGVVYQTARTDLLGLVELGFLVQKRYKGLKSWVFVPAPDLERRLYKS